jgi:hypothetical protein
LPRCAVQRRKRRQVTDDEPLQPVRVRRGPRRFTPLRPLPLHCSPIATATALALQVTRQFLPLRIKCGRLLLESGAAMKTALH